MQFVRLFKYVYLGSFKLSGSSFEDLKREISQGFTPKTIMTCSVEQLAGGEVLFSTVSCYPLDITAVISAEAILDKYCQRNFVYSDLFEDEANFDKYFVCIRCGIIVPGRDPQDTEANAALSVIAVKRGFKFSNTYTNGYMTFEMVTPTMFTKEIGGEIKNALEKVYPGKFVFENPTLR